MFDLYHTEPYGVIPVSVADVGNGNPPPPPDKTPPPPK